MKKLKRREEKIWVETSKSFSPLSSSSATKYESERERKNGKEQEMNAPCSLFNNKNKNEQAAVVVVGAGETSWKIQQVRVKPMSVAVRVPSVEELWLWYYLL